MDELLSLTVDIHHAFGPEMSVPPAERLRKARPDIDEATAQALVERAGAICGEAFALAERAFHGEMSEAEGRAKLNLMFPMLTSATLDALWAKGGYFAWHG
jgi:hypothetical protein